MAYALITTRYFDRQVAKFVRAHPDLKGRLAEVLRALEDDPFQPSLRLHPLKGQLAGLFAVSVTHSYRITLTLRIEAQEIVLLDIGSHDQVYR